MCSGMYSWQLCLVANGSGTRSGLSSAHLVIQHVHGRLRARCCDVNRPLSSLVRPLHSICLHESMNNLCMAVPTRAVQRHLPCHNKLTYLRQQL